MSKKRKLNSKNPKYWSKEKQEGPKVKKRVLLCNAPIRNSSKQVVPNKIAPIYGVWYE